MKNVIKITGLFIALYCSIALGGEQSLIAKNKESTNQDLLSAICDDNVRLVQESLKNGADPNFQDGEGQTPLMYVVGCASYNVERTMAELLLKAGADPNIRQYDDKYTVLMGVAIYGGIEMAKALIANKADINAQEEDGMTALMIATMANRIEMATVLLQAGADREIKDEDGWTALQFAVVFSSAEMVQLLVDKGADPNTKSELGRTPLMNVAIYGGIEEARILLLAGADLNAKDEEGWIALVFATVEGREDLADFLINWSDNPDNPDNKESPDKHP